MFESFYIIGVPKSGTSSLFYWLDSHPRFQGAVPKETFFFMDPDHPLTGRQGASYAADSIRAFEQFFPEARNNRIRFEGTTHYFYQQMARAYLASIDPQPLVVMLLREPASRVLSSFRFTRDNLANCDPTLTFDRYVGYLLKGQTEALDRFYTSPSSLWIAKRELALNRYVEWLDWWLELFPLEGLEIILFEELREDPRMVVTRLCSRLGVDSDLYGEFPFKGQNKTYKVSNHRLHRLARRWGSWLPTGNLKRQIKATYLFWQGRKATEDESYKEGLDALREYLAPWNRRLEARFKLDLDKWWGPRTLSRVGEDQGQDGLINGSLVRTSGTFNAGTGGGRRRTRDVESRAVIRRRGLLDGFGRN